MGRASRRASTSLVLAVVGVVAAGCGSSIIEDVNRVDRLHRRAIDHPTGTASSAAFQSCLAQHGVKIPAGARVPGRWPVVSRRRPARLLADSRPPGSPGLSASQRRAFSACQSKLPAPALAARVRATADGDLACAREIHGLPSQARC